MFAGEDLGDAVLGEEEFGDFGADGGVVEVDHDERAEGAVVDDVGIGDGADDAEGIAEFFAKDGLDEDDFWISVRVVFGVHAVVGGEGDGAASIEQAADGGVDFLVEIEDFRGFRAELVLHEVGGGEVEEIGDALFCEGGTGFEDVDRGIAGVDFGAGFADDFRGVVDAVGGFFGFVDFFGGEDDAAAFDDAIAEDGAEFFLGGDEGDLAAGVGGGC